MSDVPQGPDWWRASNGLYYPPQARPGASGDGTGGRDGDHTAAEPSPAEPTPVESPTGQPSPAEPRPDEPSTAAAPSTTDAAASRIPNRDHHAEFESTTLFPNRPDGGAERTVVERQGTEPAAAVPTDESGPAPRRRGRVVVILLAVVLVAVLAGLAVWFVLGGADDPADDTTETIATTQPDEPDTAQPDEPGTTQPDEPGATQPDEVSVFDLGVGNCFDTDEVDRTDGMVVTTVVLVDCDGPHRAVVFDITELDTPDGEAFPGTEARDAAAQELCAPGFEEYVGTSLAESDLIVLWLAPTERSWDEQDDREVTCAVARPGDEMLTGPVQSSGL